MYRKKSNVESREEVELNVDDLWKSEDALSEEDRRSRYRCGKNFTMLVQIPPWTIDGAALKTKKKKGETAEKKKGTGNKDDFLSLKKVNSTPNPPKKKKPEKVKVTPNPLINRKLSTWHGDMTKLEVDAIVNAANQTLLGGGGIDGAIHSAAGRTLFDECKVLKGCATGYTKITRGHNLPAKYILHTIGPVGVYPQKLKSCYETCLQLCLDNNIKSVAFCGISTGIFGYPLEEASRVACTVIRRWMEIPKNLEKIDRIIFCTFQDKEKSCYEELLKEFFPLAPDDEFVKNYKEETEKYNKQRMEKYNKEGSIKDGQSKEEEPVSPKQSTNKEGGDKEKGAYPANPKSARTKEEGTKLEEEGGRTSISKDSAGKKPSEETLLSARTTKGSQAVIPPYPQQDTDSQSSS